MTGTRISLIVALALIGGGLAALLLFDHHGVGEASAAVTQMCGAESESGCAEVSNSAYSKLGGVSVAALGLWFYASVLLLSALALVSAESVRNGVMALVFAGFALALVVDVVLFAVQAFAIGSFCALCIATYAVNLAALIIAIPWAGRIIDSRPAFSGSDGARALTVGAVGVVLLFVSVIGMDRAFASRPGGAPESLLGSASEPPATSSPPAPVAEPVAAPEPEAEPEVAEEPPPAPSPSAEPTADSVRIASLERELERLRGQVAKLQNTLDDPQQYQQYQLTKATAAFQQETVHDLALDGIPFKGPETAPVRVVEYSDFLCPYCRNLAGALAGYMPESNGKIAVYFKNYPLDQACNPALSRTVHDGACELALGAVCAHEQGKFWAYHDQVFAQPPMNPGNEDVVRIATTAGLDGEKMRACLGSGAASAKLSEQIQEAQALEVNSTPTVYINGKKLGQIGGFLAAIESEIGKNE